MLFPNLRERNYREIPIAMDAAEDRDLKLQRASGDLVTIFSAKLSSLLWRSENGALLRTPRKSAPVSKTEKLVSLVRYTICCSHQAH